MAERILCRLSRYKQRVPAPEHSLNARIFEDCQNVSFTLFLLFEYCYVLCYTCNNDLDNCWLLTKGPWIFLRTNNCNFLRLGSTLSQPAILPSVNRQSIVRPASTGSQLIIGWILVFVACLRYLPLTFSLLVGQFVRPNSACLVSLSLTSFTT